MKLKMSLKINSGGKSSLHKKSISDTDLNSQLLTSGNAPWTINCVSWLFMWEHGLSLLGTSLGSKSIERYKKYKAFCPDW